MMSLGLKSQLKFLENQNLAPEKRLRSFKEYADQRFRKYYAALESRDKTRSGLRFGSVVVYCWN